MIVAKLILSYVNRTLTGLLPQANHQTSQTGNAPQSSGSGQTVGQNQVTTNNKAGL